MNGLNSGCKGVVLGDTHFDFRNKYSVIQSERILDFCGKISDLNFIVITGDLVDNAKVARSYYGELNDFFKSLSGLCENVIIVVGNHDKFYEHVGAESCVDRFIYGELSLPSNVHVLGGEDGNLIYYDSSTGLRFMAISPNVYDFYLKTRETGESWVSFLDAANKLSLLLRECPTDSRGNIFLSHSPLFCFTDYDYNKISNILGIPIKIILSGHTHWGLMPWFFNGSRGLFDAQKRPFPSGVCGTNIHSDGAFSHITPGVYPLPHLGKPGSLVSNLRNGIVENCYGGGAVSSIFLSSVSDNDLWGDIGVISLKNPYPDSVFARSRRKLLQRGVWY